MTKVLAPRKEEVISLRNRRFHLSPLGKVGIFPGLLGRLDRLQVARPLTERINEAP